MKKFCFLCIIPTLFLLFVGGFTGILQETSVPSLSVVEKESYFSDFEIKEDVVYIYCTVTIKNNTNLDSKFIMAGLFPEDFRSGLLKSDILYAYNQNGESNEFTAPANTTTTFQVVFIGENNGYQVKANRLLPDIQIIEKE